MTKFAYQILRCPVHLRILESVLSIFKFLKYKYINFSLLGPAILRKPINGVHKKRQK